MKERNSKLDAHAERLSEWFGIQKMTLVAARSRLSSEFGCSVSLNALSKWWHRQQQARMQDRLLSDIASGAKFNRQLEQQLDANPPPEDRTLMQLIKTLIAQLAVQGAADTDTMKMVATFTSLVLDERKAVGSYKLKEQGLNLRERQIQLDREKFEFDAAKACLKELPELKTIASNGKLTQAEKIDAIRRKLFGVLPGEKEAA